MNPSDGSRDGMDQVAHLSDADLDRLLAGKAPSDARDAEALATFFQVDIATFFKPLSEALSDLGKTQLTCTANAAA